MNPEKSKEESELQIAHNEVNETASTDDSLELRSQIASKVEESTSTPKHVFENNEGKKFSVETLTSSELNEQILNEFVDFYKFIFSNTFGGQYLVYPSIGKPISPQEVFGTEPKEFVPLEKLYNYDPSTYPKHHETQEEAVFWHDPEETKKIFLEKAKKDAHFALIRNLENNDIAGIMFGHKCTIKDLFKTEEWENPILYSGVEMPENMRNFDNFLEKLNKKLQENGYEQLKEDSHVYGWNCIATHPDVRGLEYLMRLTTEFFNTIPQEMIDELLIVGETQFESRAHFLFTSAQGLEITGVLTESDNVKKGDPVIIAGPLKIALDNFALPKEVFEQMKKN